MPGIGWHRSIRSAFGRSKRALRTSFLCKGFAAAQRGRRHAVSFRGLRLDIERRELLRRFVIPIEPKVFDLLAYVIQNHRNQQRRSAALGLGRTNCHRGGADHVHQWSAAHSPIAATSSVSSGRCPARASGSWGAYTSSRDQSTRPRMAHHLPVQG